MLWSLSARAVMLSASPVITVNPLLHSVALTASMEAFKDSRFLYMI